MIISEFSVVRPNTHPTASLSDPESFRRLSCLHASTYTHTYTRTQAPHGIARNPLPARQHYYTTVLPLQFRSMTACNLYRKRIPQPTTSANTAQVDVASDDDSDLEIEFESFEC